MPLSNAEKTRRYVERRLAEIEQMPKLPCACGCGTLIAPINKQLKPASYAHGHNPTSGRWQPGHESYWTGKPNPHTRAVHLGKKLSPAEIEQRTETRRQRNGGAYGSGRYEISPEARERINAGNRARDRTGPNNPFYGKHHTPETRARIGFKPGPDHPGWAGGVATLPYGPEFTRKYKRLIRQRDNYTCQRCGKTQVEIGRTLDIHHIDHDKLNNDPTNLVAVCHPCNVWCSYHRDEPFQRLP